MSPKSKTKVCACTIEGVTSLGQSACYLLSLRYTWKCVMSAAKAGLRVYRIGKDSARYAAVKLVVSLELVWLELVFKHGLVGC